MVVVVVLLNRPGVPFQIYILPAHRLAPPTDYKLTYAQQRS